MGTVFSSTSNPSPEPQPPSPATSSPPTMSSPDQEPKTLDENSSKLDKDNEESSQKEGEEEEEGECGFCVFMKGGGCKEAFINWENCVMETENKNEDIVEKCHEFTFQLKKCMEAHADYYEPILKAEKAAEEEVAKELEKEKLIQQSGDDNKSNANGNHQSSHIQETVK